MEQLKNNDFVCAKSDTNGYIFIHDQNPVPISNNIYVLNTNGSTPALFDIPFDGNDYGWVIDYENLYNDRAINNHN